MLSRRTHRVGALLLTGLIAVVSSVAAQSAQDVLASVRGHLRGVDAIAADFQQTFSSEYIDEKETTSGTILLKGDMYRVETSTQTFVTDGKVTWIYNRPENQVLINNYVDDETTFSLNRFLFDNDGRYYVFGMVTGPEEYRLNLRTLDNGAFFPEVTITVGRKDYQITRLEVVDANDTLITIDLNNIVVNPTVGPDSFTFLPPETSEVVDLRS